MKQLGFLGQLLSGLLDTFKTKHAGIYTTIFIILGALAALANYFQGDVGIDLPNWVEVVSQWIFYIYAFVGGAHTKRQNGKYVKPAQ